MSLAERGREIQYAGDLEELVARSQDGDQEALSELSERIRPLVTRAVRVIIAPSSDVDDVIQQVYERLVRSLKSYKPQAAHSFTAWITVLARNVALDQVRANRAVLRHELQLEPGAVESLQRVLGPTTAGPHARGSTATTPKEAMQELAGGDILPELQKGLESLSTRERETLLLHYILGYSYDEIAQLKRISPKTVLTFLSRARSKLRRSLSDPHEI